MSIEPLVPETRVLAVESHVVSGSYVGNKIAAFALQCLGCDVAVLNTVQFSNHTGYGQRTGSTVSADEILSLYQGLRQSYLDNFDIMLTGYIPGAEAVRAVGSIGQELRIKAQSAPGSFFWVLDPVMGDQGQLYVAAEVVPAYQSLLPYADLILPNQFEAETLTGVSITDMESLKKAIYALHTTYNIPHIVVTSVSLPREKDTHYTVVGSSRTQDGQPRFFQIDVPLIDRFFSGTGDLFAALTVVRMREAVSLVPGLSQQSSWLSPDNVPGTDLPLACAIEKVLASMHEVLVKTSEAMPPANEIAQGSTCPRTQRVLRARAAELRLVRHIRSLVSPGVEFKAKSA